MRFILWNFAQKMYNLFLLFDESRSFEIGGCRPKLIKLFYSRFADILQSL